MKKLVHFLGCLLMMMAMAVTALPNEARAEIAEKPVGFVVIDQDGDVSLQNLASGSEVGLSFSILSDY